MTNLPNGGSFRPTRSIESTQNANGRSMSSHKPSGRQRNPLLWLFAGAGISFLFSVYLWFFVDRQAATFVGIWVPSILSLAAAVRRPR